MTARPPSQKFARAVARRPALLLFIVVSSIYFATVSGLTSSNDGSHYALLRAIVDEGQFEISTYAHFAEGNDLSLVGDRIYSDRPPGTALLAVPFYLAGQSLPAVGQPLPSRHDPANPALIVVLLLPVLAGAGSVVLLYNLLRGWTIRPAAALLASLTLAFGTLHWKYSTVLYSHAASTFCVTLGVYLALRAGRIGVLRWHQAFGLGLVLGYSVLVEYSNVIFAGLTVLYLFVPRRYVPAADRRPGRRWIRPIAGLVLGGLIPAALLATYNAANFGAPWITSYAYAVNYPWAASLTTTFDYPLLDGLRAMLFYSDDERFLGNANQGLLLLSPVLLLAGAGMRAHYRKRRWDFVFVVGLALVYLLLFSKHHTLHGFTGDGRYFSPFIPLLVTPLAFWLERHLFPAGQAASLLAQLLFYGLAFLSVRNVALHIGFSYNYTLDPSRAAPMSTPPANWVEVIGAVFPNLANVPLYLALMAGLLICYWGLTRVRALSGPPAARAGRRS